MSEEYSGEIIESEVTALAQTNFNLPQVYGNLPTPIGKDAMLKEIKLRKDCFDLMKTENKFKAGKKKDQFMEFDDGALFCPVSGIKKPLVTKPGVEFIATYFGIKIGPYKITEKKLQAIELSDGTRIEDHIEVTCELAILNPQGQLLTIFYGKASTKETKHRFRGVGFVCPVCGKQTVRKSKQERGGGYYCWNKPGVSDGCGANFPVGSPEFKALEEQVSGQHENTNPADQHHTVIMMAKQRAWRQIVGYCGMSRYFNEADISDYDNGFAKQEPEPEKQKAQPKPIDKRRTEIKNLAMKVFNGNIDDAKKYLESAGITDLLPISDDDYARLKVDLESRIEK